MDKIKQIIFLLICLLATQITFGQRERTLNWYFGQNAGLKFYPTVTADTLGKLSTLEGCATISDTCGNLLFYTDGSTVYSKNDSIMANGTGLQGGYSSTQAALIIPKPKCDSLYYIFTTGGSNGFYCYSIVNINLNSGLGAVTSKNINLCANYTEKQAAILHCNMKDVWVICGGPTGSNFYSYLVDSSGVSTTPVISSLSFNIGGVGYLKFSPDGNYLANANAIGDSLSIHNFNSCSGQVGFLLNCPIDTCPYGLSFSGNSSRLYIANTMCLNYKSYLWQYDLSSGIPTTILSSKTLVKQLPDSLYYGALQLGADDKIYVAKYKYGPAPLNYLATINNPNSPATSCGYSDSTIFLLSQKLVIGLPNFIESYFNTNYSCLTNISVPNYSNDNSLSISPNPFSTLTTIKIKNHRGQFYHLTLYNSFGILVQDINNIKSDSFQIDRHNLESGIYFFRLQTGDKLVGAGKLVVD